MQTYPAAFCLISRLLSPVAHEMEPTCFPAVTTLSLKAPPVVSADGKVGKKLHCHHHTCGSLQWSPRGLQVPLSPGCSSHL